MEIRFTQHLVDRAKLRNIDLTKIESILRSPDELYTDTATHTTIAVAYTSKDKATIVVYIQKKSHIIAITTHPIRTTEIQKRIKSGRWKSTT